MHSRLILLRTAAASAAGETKPHFPAVLLNEPDAYCGYSSASKSGTSTISKQSTPCGAPARHASSPSFHRIASPTRRPGHE